MLRHRIAAAICGLWLVLPASAAAQNSPPGNSGVDQYLETVPDAGGDRPHGQPRDGAGGQGAVDSSTQAGAPARSGAQRGETAALERLIDGAEPRRQPTSGPGVSRNKPGGLEVTTADRAEGAAAVPPAGGVPGDSALPPSSSALSAARLTTSGSGGMGVVLPALLALTTLGTVALAVRRRRP